MKLPPKNSRQTMIVSALVAHGRPLTLKEGVGLHGNFKLSLAELTEVYQELVTRGCLQRKGLRYATTPELREHFAPAAKVNAGALVPPRAPTPFVPLSRRNIASSRGLREGSNDLRDVASLYAPFSKSTVDQN